jgi:hypothetical protein
MENLSEWDNWSYSTLKKARSVSRFLDTFHHQIAVVMKDVFSTQSATGGVRAFQNECRDLRAAAIRAALSIILDEGM